MSFDPPWKRDTPQERGKIVERKKLRRAGMKPHPGSGAGRIKLDGSDDEIVAELKERKSSFTLKRDDVATIWRQAIQHRKTPVIVVAFPGYEVTMRIKRTNEGVSDEE